jgi:hypothetical protein
MILTNLQNNRLLKYPNEIKQKIWEYVVAEEKPIRPVQLKEKSNQFIWSDAQWKKDQFGCKIGKDVNAVKPLMAVQLSLVCRQLYQEVATTHIFYRVNDFDFLNESSLSAVSTYLLAITEPRRNNIRSLSMNWRDSSKSQASETFTTVATCLGLQKLHLHVQENMMWNAIKNQEKKISGFKDALIAVRGLKALTFSYADISHYHNSARVASGKECLEMVAALLKEETKQIRSATYNQTTLANAYLNTKLDVHGGGRLGKDRKPGIVASRTRGQLALAKTLQPDGTLPKTTRPKYNVAGEYAWYVTKISMSRPAVGEDGARGVEFLVSGYPDLRGFENAEESWESVSVLTTGDCHALIYNFYLTKKKYEYRDTYGLQIVLDHWKLRIPKGEEEKRKCYDFFDSLQRLKTKYDSQAKVEAEKAAKAARAATKDDKAKAVSKKVKITLKHGNSKLARTPKGMDKGKS